MHTDCLLTEFAVIRHEVLWHGVRQGTVENCNRAAYTRLAVESDPISFSGLVSLLFYCNIYVVK